MPTFMNIAANIVPQNLGGSPRNVGIATSIPQKY